MVKGLHVFSLLILCFACDKVESQNQSDRHQEISDLIYQANQSKGTQTDSALFYAQRALRLSSQFKERELIGQSALIIGEISYQKGEFDQANEYLIKSLQALDQSRPSAELGKVYNLLGRVCQYTEQMQLALEYYRTALQTFTDNNNQKGLAETLGNLGHFNEKTGNYDSAIHYQNRAKNIYQALKDSSGLAHIYDNIGSIYEDLEQFDKARINFKNAYEINTRQGNETEALINLNNLGDIFRKTNQLKKAEEVTTRVLDKAKLLDQQYQIRSAYRDLGKIYELMSNNLLAYQYLDSCYQITSEIYSQEIANEIAETRAFYEVEQKEQQIALLEKDNEISRVTRYALAGVSILIFGIGGLVYLQQRTRIRKNKTIYEAEKEVALANENQLKAELNFKKLQEQNLHQELETRSRELTANALHIIQKNEFLESLKSELKEVKKSKDEVLNKKVKKIIKSIDLNFNLDDDWQEFETIFQQVHEEFFLELRKEFPNLSAAEVRLCAMLRLNLNSKDIATIMGISQDSLRISRYRLRKKLGIDKGANLYSFIMNIG